MTAKQLEQETGCKIMVRGKGSMRDRKKASIVPSRTKTKIDFKRHIYLDCFYSKDIMFSLKIHFFSE